MGTTLGNGVSVERPKELLRRYVSFFARARTPEKGAAGSALCKRENEKARDPATSLLAFNVRLTAIGLGCGPLPCARVPVRPRASPCVPVCPQTPCWRS